VRAALAGFGTPGSGTSFGASGRSVIGAPISPDKVVFGFRTPKRAATDTPDGAEAPDEDDVPPVPRGAVSIRAVLEGRALSVTTTGDGLTGSGRFGTSKLRVTGGAMTGWAVALRGTMSGPDGGSSPFRLIYNPGSGSVRITFKNSAGGDDITASGKVEPPE
jgi:hypothetical protein